MLYINKFIIATLHWSNPKTFDKKDLIEI